jgi:hypothetical protein
MEAEFFYPTIKLRFLEKEVEINSEFSTVEKVLQQLHQGSNGSVKWVDVPTAIEQIKTKN